MTVIASSSILQKKPSTPLLFAFLLTALSGLSLGHYVKTRCSGHTWSCYKPSAHFPPPSAVAATTEIKPIMSDGWDGQFYLYQSYDPLMQNLKSISTSFDAPAYRYQRNFLPGVVYILGLLPLPVSHATWFMLVQLSIMAFGSYIVANFFYDRGWSLFWLVPMHINSGVFETLRHGLPDASTDFLLYAAVALILQRKTTQAGLALVPLCLMREPYTILAATLAGLSMLSAGKLWVASNAKVAGQKDVHGVIALNYVVHLKQMISYATGPAIFVLWYCYVRTRMSGSPTAQGQFMLTWPFFGLWQLLHTPQFYATLGIHRLTTCYYASLLSILFVVVLRYLRTHPLYFGIFVLCALNSCISWLGWYSLSHSGKNFAYTTGLIPILLVLPWSTRPLWKVQTALAFVLTPAIILAVWAAHDEHKRTISPTPIHGYYEVDAHAGLFHGQADRRRALYESAGCPSEEACNALKCLQDGRARITLQTNGVKVLRSAYVASIDTVTYNSGLEAWLPFYNPSVDATHFELTIYNEHNEIIRKHRHSLNRVVSPKQAVSASLTFRVPRQRGTYRICVDVAQGKHNFNFPESGNVSCTELIVE